jgi:hypothetical protein
MPDDDRPISLIVIAGLDPAIHHLKDRRMDARVKPAHDNPVV